MRSLLAALILLALAPSALAKDDLLRTAASNGSLDTLVSLVVAAGLDDALDDGAFTIFAPTDEAFAALPAETLASLRKPENRERLAGILKFHVVDHLISVPEHPPSHRTTKATTLQGASLDFKRDGTALFVNDARVTVRNIDCTNGLIQVIDRVLLPPAPSASHEPELTVVKIRSDWNTPIVQHGLRADRIEITCLGGGRVALHNVVAGEVVTRILGGGEVSIEGWVRRHEAHVNGGAVLDARALATESTSMTVNGGGQATVWALEHLDFRVNAGGTVRYVKTDAEVEQSVNRYAKVEVINPG